MVRGLFTFLCIVSLLLLGATILFWVRGHWAADQAWLLFRDGGSEMVRSERGEFTVRHTWPNGREQFLSPPRRFTHWSFKPGSQMAPRPTRLHARWHFLRFEGKPAATPQEIRTARQLIDSGLPNGPVRPAPGAPTPPPGLWPPGTRPPPVAMESARDVLHGTAYREVTFPAWLAAAAFAAPPALWLALRARRRRRQRKGFCPACGYDLRATPGRCPECGWSVPTASAT